MKKLLLGMPIFIASVCSAAFKTDYLTATASETVSGPISINGVVTVGSTTADSNSLVKVYKDHAITINTNITLNATEQFGSANSFYLNGDVIGYWIYPYRTINGTKVFPTAGVFGTTITISQDGNSVSLNWGSPTGTVDGYYLVRRFVGIFDPPSYDYYDAGNVFSAYDDGGDAQITWTALPSSVAPNPSSYPETDYVNYINGSNIYAFNGNGKGYFGAGGYFGGNVGIFVATPTAKLDMAATSGNETVAKITTLEHTSSNPNDFSIYDSVGVEVAGLAAWSGGGGAHGYGSVVLGSSGSAGIRLGEIGGRNALNNYRVCDFIFQTGGAADKGEIVAFLGSGSGAFQYAQFWGINGSGFGGLSTATAKVHIAAGTTSPGTAQIKLNAGSILSTPELGAIEYNGTDIFLSTGTTATTRSKFVRVDPTVSSFTSGRIPFTAANAILKDTSDMSYSAGTITLSTLTVNNTATLGTTTVNGKLTVKGAIDPISVSLSSNTLFPTTSFYFESAAGQNSGVAQGNLGRLIYNNSTKTWQASVNGGAYTTISTVSAAGLLPNNVVDGSSITKQGYLTAGTNITLTPGAGILTIAASGSSGGGYAIEPATVTIKANQGLTATFLNVTTSATINSLLTGTTIQMSSGNISGELDVMSNFGIGGPVAGNLTNNKFAIIGDLLQWYMKSVNAGADAKIWQFQANSSGVLSFSANSDSFGGASDWLTVARSGAIPTNINFPNGKLAIGSQTPTANLHITAGAAGASSAPLKINSGTKQTTAEAGTIEYNGNWYATKSNAIRFSQGGILFDHYVDTGNATTVETDLYSDSIAANTLDANGCKVLGQYGGIFVNSTSTKQLKVYLGTTTIFDTGALTISAASDFVLNVTIVRDGTGSVRTITAASLTGASTGSYANYVLVGGLSFSGANTLKITGTAAGVGAATNDIVAKMAFVEYKAPQ